MIVLHSFYIISTKFGHRFSSPLPFFRCLHTFPCCSSSVRWLSDGIQQRHQPMPAIDRQPTNNSQNVPTKVPPPFDNDTELMEWTEDELALKEKAIAENSWTPVFRYRGFAGVWFVLRMNFVFCAVALATLPLSIVVQAPIAPSLGLILFASIVFICIRKYFTRIVGVISVDSASHSIYRIGYPSIFGARRNRFARVLDVVPMSSNPDSPRGVGRLLFADGAENNSKKEYLLVPTVNVEILDKKAAFLLFGSSMQHFDKDIVPSADGRRQKRVNEMLRLGMEKRKEAPKIEGR